MVKPNVIVNLKDLQTKTEKLTILTCDNNFYTLSTTIEELQQEINAKKGDDFCKDDKLLSPGSSVPLRPQLTELLLWAFVLPRVYGSRGSLQTRTRSSMI